MSNLLNANHRVRSEIMETTAILRLRGGFSSAQNTMAVLSFCAEYVKPVARHASLHVRHAPILEPGCPAAPHTRGPG